MELKKLIFLAHIQEVEATKDSDIDIIIEKRRT